MVLQTSQHGSVSLATWVGRLGSSEEFELFPLKLEPLSSAGLTSSIERIIPVGMKYRNEAVTYLFAGQ